MGETARWVDFFLELDVAHALLQVLGQTPSTSSVYISAMSSNALDIIRVLKE